MGGLVQCDILKFNQHRARDMERKRMVKSMGQHHLRTSARRRRTRECPLWKRLSERAIFRSVPVQVWYGNVMYQVARLLEKIMHDFEKCLLFMKFLSANVPLADAKLICIPLQC